MKFKTFVINLKRRIDRLTDLSIPFEYEIFEATDGMEVFTDFRKKNRGILGCLDSHKRLLSVMENSDYDFVLIFEDDVEFCENFLEKFWLSYNSLPNQWDMFYLGGNNIEPPINYNTYLDKITKVYTTHAYMINKKFIPIILKSIEQSQSIKIDVIFSEIHRSSNCFMSNPKLCFQKKGYSDIENKFTNNIHLR